MDSNKRRQILTGHTGSVHALVVVRKLLISGSPEDQSIKVTKQKALKKAKVFYSVLTKNRCGISKRSNA